MAATTHPAGAVPSYTAVLVTDLVGKNGKMIGGTKPSIAIVQVNPGYSPNPGHPGTAVVLGPLSVGSRGDRAAGPVPAETCASAPSDGDHPADLSLIVSRCESAMTR